MGRGDHLRVYRGGLHHHGIDLGDGSVVHFAQGDAGMTVVREPIERFAGRGKVEVVEYAEPVFHPDQVCLTALREIGQGSYDIRNNNCEHLATWCKRGSRTSSQVAKSYDWIGGRMRAALLMNPAMVPVVPLVEITRRVGLRAVHEATAPFRDAPPGALVPRRRPWPLFLRLAFGHVDGSGREYQLTIDGRWLLGTTPSAPPEEPTTCVARFWTDDAGRLHRDTAEDWAVADGNGWVALPAVRPVPEGGPCPLVHAPEGALNALLEVPSTPQELVDAMEEVAVRGRGDHTTYRLLSRVALGADVSGVEQGSLADRLYLRQAALWTLGMVERAQHADLPTSQLPALPVIGEVVRRASEPSAVRCAAVQALQVIGRPRDPLVHPLLVTAAGSGDRELARLAADALGAGAS